MISFKNNTNLTIQTFIEHQMKSLEIQRFLMKYRKDINQIEKQKIKLIKEILCILRFQEI